MTQQAKIFAITVLFAFVFSMSPPCRALGQTQAKIQFNRDVRPILSAHCLSCHGPDESSRQAGLRLDSFKDATESAIEPGNADNSILIQRIESSDDPMPPEGHGKRLTNKETQTLRAWIDAGSEYERHWAFVKPVKPPQPNLSNSENTGVTTATDRIANNPIDQFILHRARQQAKSQKESNLLAIEPVLQQQAEPARLIRRVALDLTGLPPTPEMVNRFVDSPTDETFALIVDQLLADDAYGEHWASMWLDLARYADTVGYASDENRTIWPWRDWLIRALNDNQPYDQFTHQVIAGDLLPNATDQQRLATAFHRNTLNNNEGGTNDEEFRTVAVKDRLSTTLNTWMGLTVRCAECHSHKYDPISHREYHQLLDFFNQTADADRPNEHPVLEIRKDLRVPVLQELDTGKRRTTHIMKRGNFQQLGDSVTAAVPESLHPFPADMPLNRLGLAQWLMDPTNPLTARVAVNRYWARLFGKGLVVSEEDFGTQGSPPSHPKLLDWLAVDFQSDWDVKRALRQMVLSKTYRQSSRTAAAQTRADPNNTWLMRGARFRLPAETVRDQALAVSGLLSRKMFGPPVYPPNPVKQIANAFSNARAWETSTGQDRYRRSLYTFLKRSQPHPLFETFDMNTRDVCGLRRIRTNTPLQSFMTMNDDSFVEAAQALAKKAWNQNKADKRKSAKPAEARIELALRAALMRKPDSDQVAVLSKLYQGTLVNYQQDQTEAEKMIGDSAKEIPDDQIPQLAALTVVCNVILNLDEFLTR